MNRRWFLLLAAVTAIVVPGRADAHLVNTGFGPFYDGISHLFVTAPDLLAVTGLALLLGLRSRRAARSGLAALLGSWIVAGAAGLAVGGEATTSPFTMVSFLIVGALLAWDRDLSIGALVPLALAIGALHGFLNGAESAAARIGWVGFAGSVTALAVTATIVAAIAVTAAHGWTRLAVRVAGSWIAAVGILMLGWLFRPLP